MAGGLVKHRDNFTFTFNATKLRNYLILPHEEWLGASPVSYPVGTIVPLTRDKLIGT